MQQWYLINEGDNAHYFSFRFLISVFYDTIFLISKSYQGDELARIVLEQQSELTPEEKAEQAVSNSCIIITTAPHLLFCKFWVLIWRLYLLVQQLNLYENLAVRTAHVMWAIQ